MTLMLYPLMLGSSYVCVKETHNSSATIVNIVINIRENDWQMFDLMLIWIFAYIDTLIDEYKISTNVIDV